MKKEEFIEYFNEHDYCSSRMGIRLVDLGEGTATATLPLTDLSSNFMGAMHGGAMSTLADITAGCCMYYRGRLCVTLDADVRYLRGIRQGIATARAKEIHAGGRISVMSVEITDEEDNLCCVATISMFLSEQTLESFEPCT